MTTATESFKTFIFCHPVKVSVGAERYIVTSEIRGQTIETKTRVDMPLNNNGQEVESGWLGSFTSGSTTTDRYSHGLKKVLAIEPKYDWNYDLDQPQKEPYSYEITWG